MTIRQNKLYLFFLLLFFSFCVLASETSEGKFEIKAYSSEITIGEPLILEIHAISNTPNINPNNGESTTSVKMDTLNLLVTQKGHKEEIEYKIWPITFFDNSGKGLEYSGFATILWGELDKIFIFDKTGVFNCRVGQANENINSNTIEIKIVPPSEKEKKAMSIIKDYHDLKFIEFGGESTPDIVSRLEQIVEQCGDTMLAKLAAARLGIENTKHFENKYSENKAFIEQYRKGEIKDPLIESAKKYLSMAYELPDEVPIRENAIYNLATFELFDSETKKAFAIYDELVSKYPQGKYGKQALRDKKDSQEYIENHQDLFVVENEQSQTSKPLGVVFPILGAAVALIAIASLILFTRKKKLNKVE